MPISRRFTIYTAVSRHLLPVPGDGGCVSAQFPAADPTGFLASKISATAPSMLIDAIA
jgi:hypothetical protein